MEDLSASADGVIISLRRADADLSAVMHRLDSEFQHRFPREVSTSMLLGPAHPSQHHTLDRQKSEAASILGG